MATAQKILNKMKNNPRDWRIEQLETVAKHYGISVRKPGGSHMILSHPKWLELLCVPAHRPIKPIYIKKLILLVDLLGENG